MREIFTEIWSSMRKNKLRTFLTGFSVAWGILMLIILLSSGNGLQNGMMSNFDYMATNSIELYSSRTSMPYAGYAEGRSIYLSGKDIEILEEEFPNVDKVTSSAWYSGGTMTRGKNYINVSMHGVRPAHTEVFKIEILEGRFINRQDIDRQRKVCVISQPVREVLFGNESPIGKEVIQNGVVWTVAGVYKDYAYGNQNSVFIPYTTGRLIYMQNDPWIGYIVFTLQDINTDEEMAAFEDDVLRRLSFEHNYAPTDKNAIYLYNNFNQFKGMNRIFRGLDMFIWIIGLGTLLAGIVGVSNIMLVTVRERTFEFGIRKALGARPASIIRLILIESVVITAFFGYVGLVLGVAVMEVVNHVLEATATAVPDSFAVFRNPTLDLRAAVSATVVLIIAGLVAGYVPARKAARLKTIDALRYNK